MHHPSRLSTDIRYGQRPVDADDNRTAQLLDQIAMRFLRKQPKSMLFNRG
nr:unnamed protein product [Callosobruchus analis]